jgi:hypothetical protein
MVLIFLILFVLLASPMAFRTIRGVLGPWVSSAEGLPTLAGLVLHAFVFGLILRLIKRPVRPPQARVSSEPRDPSITRATDYGSTLASKGPDAII